MTEPPPKPLFHVTDEINAHEQFHSAYGAMMAAWARLEGCLFHWFMSATELSEPRARAIYFSARSFTGRHDMLVGALPFDIFDEPIRKVIRAGIKKARKYSEFRNAVAHGEPVFDIRQQSATWGQFLLTDGRTLDDDPDAVTIKQLEIATSNFNELRRLLWDVHPMYRKPSLNAEGYLRLIRELPNQARSSEPTPIPEEP
jgi:hypothetical protein